MAQENIPSQVYWWGSDINLDEYLRNKELVLFIDYDGTLAPIAKLPDQAFLSENMAEVLNTLSQFPHCHVVVISGRALPDLKKMIDIPNIIYVGNHGFEVEGITSFNLETMIPAQYFDDLANIKTVLSAKLSVIEGLWVEDKGINLTVHYRPASEKAGVLARRIFKRECQPYLDENRIFVMQGKKVLEIRPPIRWTKGEAALLILYRIGQDVGKDNIATMYVGDDVTDEDAFKALNQIGITIRVGQQAGSGAQYFVEKQSDVLKLLQEIVICQINRKSVNPDSIR